MSDASTSGRHSSVSQTSSRIFASLRFQFLGDRKSTRLNSSHSQISYAVFCLKKKKNTPTQNFTLQLHGLHQRISDVLSHSNTFFHYLTRFVNFYFLTYCECQIVTYLSLSSRA